MQIIKNLVKNKKKIITNFFINNGNKIKSKKLKKSKNQLHKIKIIKKKYQDKINFTIIKSEAQQLNFGIKFINLIKIIINLSNKFLHYLKIVFLIENNYGFNKY